MLLIILLSGATLNPPDSSAAETAIAGGEVIVEPVALETVRPGDEIDIVVWRDGVVRKTHDVAEVPNPGQVVLNPSKRSDFEH